MTRRPALHDVAALAGVSHQTVSRVLNDHPHVSPDTRRKVEVAISELGYRRNLSARVLVTGRSNVVGVISPSSTLYGPSATVTAIGQAALASGLTVTADQVLDLGPTQVRAAADRLLGQGVMGLVLILPVDAAVETVSSFVPAGTPMVTGDSDVGPTSSHVSIDQYSGAVQATEHLLALGHRTVWHIAGPLDWNDSRAREKGWRDTLTRAGVEEPPLLRGDWSPASGYEAGRMLARVTDCTAVFAANDHMALGIARALFEAGRRIPEDVSLVGFDDVPESGYYFPPLTTVHQDFDATGRAALELLRRQADGDDTGQDSVLVPAHLVLRQSTARR
ncbi:LacI family DNA-binding transcriptional regulator [Williamsia sp. CHRR-6]|uniref:LacI family DNA-binding transcriptional regulator n=1 Tax=Williamsia sp. CHRR-6 TaxID=2835871 RepID=UPI001BDA13C1|nr:LacI family DNA-binding transcriptional regulator [Williamsia sp. CHRR-6]MBT0567114.1 LacI family DNA-binding transcriptional regulator [Williamsia sp. CHRR-6]